MSKDHPHHSKASRRALFQVEGLEDRALMSGIRGASASLPVILTHRPLEQTLTFAINGSPYYVSQQASAVHYVSQQDGAIDVTITRAATGVAPRGNAGIKQEMIDLPLTVNFTASLASVLSQGQPSSLPASASETFTPVSASITFPAGVTTETVQIPVNPDAANPGSVPIQLSANSASPGVSGATPDLSGASAVLYLVAGPVALVPMPTYFTDVHYVVQGKIATGISMTFSHPMSPASVENVHNYAVTTGHLEDFYEVFPFGHYKSEVMVPVPLKAARYDPATNTVTLVVKKPKGLGVVYEIRNATPLSKHRLTDLQGNAVQANGSGPGAFYFALNKGYRPTDPAALGRPTMF
jgi:hypothetical protein